MEKTYDSVDIYYKDILIMQIPFNKFNIFPYMKIIERNMKNGFAPEIDLYKVLGEIKRVNFLVKSMEILLDYYDYKNEWKRTLIDPRPYNDIIYTLADYFLLDENVSDIFDKWTEEYDKSVLIGIKHGRKILMYYKLDDFKSFVQYKELLENLQSGNKLIVDITGVVPFKEIMIECALNIIMNWDRYSNNYIISREHIRLKDDEKCGEYIIPLAKFFGIAGVKKVLKPKMRINFDKFDKIYGKEY